MTLGGRIVTLFPIAHLAAIVWAVNRLATTPSIKAFVGLVIVLYGIPLMLFRIHEMFAPLDEGVTDIGAYEYSPWWTGHQLQLLYGAIPWLEAPLHLIPGAFSLWLRLWGSEIGKGVHWTPRVEVIDRSMISVGDGAVIGHLVIFCSHGISPVEGKMSLVVERIRLGQGAFVGAEARLGPGTVVADGGLVRTGAVMYRKGALR